MSGLFKNFDRLICASNFSNPNHKFIVKSYLQRFSPASLYYNSENKLDRTHSQDIFELSLVAYQLQRQNLIHQNWLQNLDESSQNFITEIEEKSAQNASYITDALREINLQFQVGISETPISGLTSYTFLLGQQADIKASQKQFNTYVKPALLEKIGYASQQDLADLVQGLRDLQIYDKAVWDRVLSTLQNKTFDWQLNTVNYHGWDLDIYEAPENNNDSIENQLSANQRYYNDIQNQKGGFLAQQKRNISNLWNEVYYRAINPFFFRENRANESFYTVDGQLEKEQFLSNLQQVASQVPAVTSVLQNIQNKGVNY